jgi:GTP-binding protein Era
MSFLPSEDPLRYRIAMSATPHRFGIVGILGRPNVGKSTLLNRVLGQKLAIATPKPQTTRDRIKGIRTFEDWQVVWVDTPGIHEAQTKLNRYMVELAIATVAEVDLCYVLVDAAKAVAGLPHGGAPGEGETGDRVMAETKAIIAHVADAKKKAFLVLNKVDKLADKSQLLAVIERYATLYPWAEIVPVSAKTSSNVDALLAATRAHLPEGAPLFAADELTDRPMRFIAKEIIREQLFLQLAQELPYSVAVDVLSWEEKGDGLVVVHANVHVARRSHKPIVVGKGGAQIKTIGERSRQILERLLERKVYLDLRVKVDEDWTDRDDKLRALGYDQLQ